MWIKTKAYYKPDIPSVEWEIMDEDQRSDAAEPIDFRFNTDDVLNYNRSSRNESTIRFRTYEYSIGITMTLEELDAIIFQNNS